MTSADMKGAKALTITYLATASLASLNGSDSEADNISSIKKIVKGDEQYPYVSAQALRRALRDQLGVLGWELSEAVAATIKKGAATTQQEPHKYIDDDLFGFMGTEEATREAKGKATKRTGPVRVSPLVALDTYQGDLDFGTNYMAVKAGGDPNIFETEIHSGLYRGTILIELDRVGRFDMDQADGKKTTPAPELASDDKAARVIGLLTALKNLWTSGRQARYLADIAPKFVAAALLRVKNPIFLEAVLPTARDDRAAATGIGIDRTLLEETVEDYAPEIMDTIFGARSGMFANLPDGTTTIGNAFTTMCGWVRENYAQGQ
jgi:CRISPR-associated protein Cst2